MAEEVNERLDFLRFAPRQVLVIGDAAGLLRDALSRRGAEVESLGWHAWAAERPLPPARFDMVVADHGLASVNDLPGALVHLRRALTSQGMLLASIAGAGSVPRLRAAILAAETDRAYARIHPQVDSRSASMLMQRTGFHRQVVDTARLTVRYGSLARLVDDLRDHGLGNVLRTPGPPLTRRQRSTIEAFLRAEGGADGRWSELFEMITLSGWTR
ncbi:methyltransferase [Erythrobacteraceae bacterium CFH 75059]|uniref:methyltransferase n=1 Tax=Qipengyuania thermophila TaxID=2509361 RepID=UPI001021F7A7|nr:methyltransferase [Qipengyuania thermophila]TCD05160.1 methyltransferase [Erythrobacteraceae bacterium CFH 75059]